VLILGLVFNESKKSLYVQCDMIPAIFRLTEASLAFKTALILHGVDTTRYWKLSSEILVYIYWHHSLCRFFGCTYM